jgi:acyl transferase domain-containing protein/SAM-dependent methyltransferase/acyl carrier protein/NADP-dependent 3-hydroxy acid dehydrogenase YdfG
MQARIDALENRDREPIAIVGLGCRFPGGANDEDSFWRLLAEGADLCTEVPKDRWNPDDFFDPDPDAPAKLTARHGAFLRDVDRFDAGFFSIAPREAAHIDPQQRLLLEVAWEALENAGIAADHLRGSRTGVFVGIASNDYAQFFLNDPDSVDIYAGTGSAFNTAAGRISYVLGLQGPSLALDTACSSSLVALHLACQSLRNHECNLALAGGVNLMLTPFSTVVLSRIRVLSPTGKCRTFDADADGFVRGEGCALLALMRHSDAVRNGERILAVIRGSAVNHDGPSGGLTVPSREAQEAVIREALANAGVAPERVSYLETHGTATPLGDPIEIRAIRNALGLAGNGPALNVGSVKTNMGHLEAAAGIAGVCKVVAALRHGKIPPHLHFHALNPHIENEGEVISVSSVLKPWTDTGGLRVAGVSGFGISGTNAHVVVEEAPALKPKMADQDRPQHVLALSAKTPEALRELALKYDAVLADPAHADLADLCYTANAGRSHFSNRAAVWGNSAEQLRERLVRQALSPALLRPAGIVFLFSGQGAQYPGMGRGLYDTQPVFRRALDACAEIADIPLLEVMYGSKGDLLSQTAYTQPALFALEWSLAELWRSWGVRPSAVMGHSVGEFAAACVAGAMDWRDAMRLVTARGRLMQSLPASGEMWAVAATEAEVKKVAGTVGIAAVNAERSVVIAGPSASMRRAVEALERQGVRSQRLDVSHAFHSALMDPAMSELERLASGVKYRRTEVPWIANVTGEPMGELTGRYWREQARGAVRFAAGMKRLKRGEFGAYLELGPGTTLIGLGKQDAGGEDAAWLSSLRRGKDDWSQTLESLAALYERGADIDWKSFDEPYARRKVALPTYPFQRESHWTKARPLAVKTPAQPGNDWLYELKWESSPLRHSRISALPALPQVKPIIENLSLNAGFFAVMDRLSGAYARQAIAQLDPGARIRPPYQRLRARLDEIAVDAAEDPVAQLEEAVERYPACEAELRLLSHCAAGIPDVLRGERTGPEIMFPGGDATLVEAVYFGSQIARVANRLVVDAVLAAIRDTKGTRPIRILEIGGGTGSTTAALLPELPLDRVEYLFTDVSKFFVSRATQTFAQYPFVHCQTLDITRPPDSQGLSLGEFDIVIAANVFHATPSIQRSVAHAAGLLSPGGWIVLMENTGAQAWLDLTFGLLEDWWNFQDPDLRPHQPLLSEEAWIGLLTRCGMTDATATTGLRFADDQPQHALFLARKHREPEDWVILGDDFGLRDLLESQGREVRPTPGPNTNIVFIAGEAPMEAAVRLYQSIAEMPDTHNVKVWLVTQRAQATGREPVRPSPAHAALWGFARVAALEYPEIRGGIIDLDEASADRLQDAITSANGEDQIAVRGATRFVPRFAPATPPRPANTIKIRPDRTYLITGGLGNLGLRLAEWLADRGALSLVLTSRSGIRTTQQRSRVEALRARGIDVATPAVDSSNRERMEQLIAELQDLAGVIHAAGVSEVCPIAATTQETIDSAFDGKAKGAWLLHELTATCVLDFFVLFSSGAAIWGSNGSSQYAAANAALDLLAHYRRQQGLPALSINWGVWDERDKTTREETEFLERSGMRAMSVHTALAMLDRLIRSDRTQVTVADIDWSVFLPVYEARRKRPVVERMRSDRPAIVAPEIKPTRPGSMLEFVRTETAAVLGLKPGHIPDPRQPLFEMGIDSFMALELKRRLENAIGAELPSTLVFNYPTIEAISDFVAKKTKGHSNGNGERSLAQMLEDEIALAEELT